MRKAVRDAFVEYSDPLEGTVPFMYLDHKGLVTCAIGCLVDPVGLALGLPFVHPGGAPATEDEIRSDFARVKLRQDLRLRGGMIFRDVARLRLTPDGITTVVERKLRTALHHLRKLYPAWDSWCADAQLAVLSKAWASGSFFGRYGWPKLHAALKRGDWATAAAETVYRGRGTIVERGRRERALFGNAALVEEYGADPDTLYWPGSPEAPTPDPQFDEPLRGVGSPGYQATSDAVHDAARRHLERERE